MGWEGEAYQHQLRPAPRWPKDSGPGTFEGGESDWMHIPGTHGSTTVDDNCACATLTRTSRLHGMGNGD